MLGASTGLATGQDSAAAGHEILQEIDILVVDEIYLIGAELTYMPPTPTAAASSPSTTTP